MTRIDTPHGQFVASIWPGRHTIEIRSEHGTQLGDHLVHISAAAPAAGPIRAADVDVQRYVWHPRPNGGGSGGTLGRLDDPATCTQARCLVVAIRDELTAGRLAGPVELVEVTVGTAYPADVTQMLTENPLRHRLRGGPWQVAAGRNHVTLTQPVWPAAVTDRDRELHAQGADLAAGLAELGMPAQVRVQTCWVSPGVTLPSGPVTVTDDHLEAVTL